MNKAIAHFGNMANDAFPIVEELQALGENVHLYVSSRSHVTALPQWELLKLDISDIGSADHPDMTRLNRDFVQPEWIHFLDLSDSMLIKLNKLRKEMRKYDLIIAHLPFFMYSYILGARYVPFEAGTIRYFNEGKTLYSRMRFWLMKRSYQRAKLVIMTNPDTLDLCERYRLNWIFVPFAINMERYKPSKVEPLNYDNVVFCYSRQNWREKGQDKLIRAFARFLRDSKDSVLVCVERDHEDIALSKTLVSSLGIEKNVLWIPLMSKPYLVQWINRSTVVADQFNLGSSGTAGFEAMACGKPLIIYLSVSHFRHFYSEFPPVLNATTEDEILESLRVCADKKAREDLGQKSRQWVSKYHDAAKVARKHLEIYEKVLGSS